MRIGAIFFDYFGAGAMRVFQNFCVAVLAPTGSGAWIPGRNSCYFKHFSRLFKSKGSAYAVKLFENMARFEFEK